MSTKLVPSLASWTVVCLVGVGGPALAQSPILVTAGQPDGDSLLPIASGTGRYVLFTSDAQNLVPGDLGGHRDVFLRDLLLKTTELVSVGTDGVQGNQDSHGTDLSPDGRFVVFASAATNLVSGGSPGLYVRDRQTGITTLETLSTTGASAGSFQDEGHISDDGHWLVFSSWSKNFVPDDTNSSSDIFLRDRWAGTLERVSVGANGEQANNSSFFGSRAPLSADGSVLVFDSQATNLVPGYVSHGSGDAYARNLASGTTQLLNVTSGGEQGSSYAGGASITADGRWAAFVSNSANLLPSDPTPGQDDLFLRDLQTGNLEIGSLSSSGAVANQYSFDASLSADGRWLAMRSAATNLNQLVSGGTFPDSLYLRDRLTGLTWVVDVDAAGVPTQGFAFDPDLSRDGRAVVFTTPDALLAQDSHFGTDIYAYDRFVAVPFAVLPGGAQGASGFPELLAEGPLKPQSVLTIALANTPGHTALLVVGYSQVQLPFKGGTLIPAPNVIVPLTLPSSGPLHLTSLWPSGIPPGARLYLQAWIPDAAAAEGFAASNGLLATAH